MNFEVKSKKKREDEKISRQRYFKVTAIVLIALTLIRIVDAKIERRVNSKSSFNQSQAH